MKNKILESKKKYLVLILLIFNFEKPICIAQSSDYSDYGISLQGRLLILNNDSKLLKTTNYSYSFGVYYDYVNSDFFSIPIYLTYTNDNFKFYDINKRVNLHNINLELSYRKYIYFGLDFISRIYIELGIQNDFTTNPKSIVTNNNEILVFSNYNISPELSIGFELGDPFVY